MQPAFGYVDKPLGLGVLNFMDTIEVEIWKDISGWEGFYKISNMGRVKSLSRIVVNEMGVHNCLKEKVLKNTTGNGKRGYWMVTLYRDKCRFAKKVHRILAQAFIPNPENKPQVNHKDGDKHNLTLSNLEWVTVSENVKHSFDTNLNTFKGDKHPFALLSNSDAIYIYKSVKSIGQLAKEYNVGKHIIWSIKGGKSWAHITGAPIKRRKTINQEQRKYILESTLPTKIIAKNLGLKYVQVWEIKFRKRRK